MASIFKPAGKSKYVIFYHDENGKPPQEDGATDKASHRADRPRPREPDRPPS